MGSCVDCGKPTRSVRCRPCYDVSRGAGKYPKVSCLSCGREMINFRRESSVPLCLPCRRERAADRKLSWSKGLDLECLRCARLRAFDMFSLNPKGAVPLICDHCASATRRRRVYGTRKGELRSLLDKQHGGCAICARRVSLSPRRARAPGLSGAHVDHCHETGKVRGILCPGCNLGLGKLGDNVEGLQRALDYLRGGQPMTPKEIVREIFKPAKPG